MSIIKLGVAISVYNKVDEVLTSVNVIREAWNNKDVWISVCCNDKNSYDLLKQDDRINKISLGYDFKPDHFYNKNSKAWKRMRQYDTIKNAVLGCVDNSDYAVQWHADACALDEEIVMNIVNEMEKKDYYVGFRGKWKGQINPKTPVGHIDDHFCFFNCLHLKESNCFSNDSEQIRDIASKADRYSSEGILSYLIQKSTKVKNLYHYDDMSKNEVDIEVAKTRKDYYYKDNGYPHSAIPPYNFDPVRKFLHSDRYEDTIRFFERCGISKNLIVNNK